MANQIDALNRALKKSGQPITLRRVTGTTTQTFTDVVCQAVVRGYTPQEIIPGSGIEQQDSLVILSPTEINNAVWPAPQGANVGDIRIPSKNRGDVVVINGAKRMVQAGVGIYMPPSNTLVRIEMRVR